MSNASRILPLELRAVTFETERHRLIKEMSFQLAAEGRTIILGSNGAGKSLLLRLCHGLIRPSQGEIIWQGAAGRDPKHFQAMVFQRPVMLRRSAAANIHFPLSIRGIPRSSRRHVIEEALRLVGLGRFSRTPAHLLSIGEQQRLALARAWALKPQILFLDEPTANLDPAATHVIEEVIAEMDRAGTKIVMTTHDLGQARRLADEIMFIHRGRLLEKAPAAAFFDCPQNDMARSFLRGELLWWQRRELTP
ncbi:MAG: ATP-binding cassette domain-containing protein [Alphaproteobacteria bacterium]|nr:ATP-binding cassette domain-containing protein [Alphaproteobacteria bacterium]